MEDRKIYIGVDPGKNGAIAIILLDGTWEFYEIPKIGTAIDVSKLNAIFSNIRMEAQLCEAGISCAIEDVHAIFGASAKSTFEFGYVVGLLEMVLVANSIPFTKVAPKTWQKQMWQGVSLQKKTSSTGKTMVNDTKAISEIAARRLYPKIDFRRTERCKTSDDGKVDSILLCTYAKRYL